MSESFESLDLSPWIVRQMAKLGNYQNRIHMKDDIIYHYFLFIFYSENRFEESNTHPNELYSTDFERLGLYWCCQNWVTFLKRAIQIMLHPFCRV